MREDLIATHGEDLAAHAARRLLVRQHDHRAIVGGHGWTLPGAPRHPLAGTVLTMRLLAKVKRSWKRTL